MCKGTHCASQRSKIHGNCSWIKTRSMDWVWLRLMKKPYVFVAVFLKLNCLPIKLIKVISYNFSFIFEINSQLSDELWKIITFTRNVYYIHHVGSEMSSSFLHLGPLILIRSRDPSFLYIFSRPTFILKQFLRHGVLSWYML